MAGKKQKKAMTLKEFEAALDLAGIGLDIYGWEGLLNLMAMAKHGQYVKLSVAGLPAAAAGEYESWQALDKTLRARGYYDK